LYKNDRVGRANWQTPVLSSHFPFYPRLHSLSFYLGLDIETGTYSSTIYYISSSSGRHSKRILSSSVYRMSPSVHISWPSSSIFKFPPDNEPHALPPASPGSSLSAPPFAISPSLYNAVLDVKVPITIACVYAASVVSLNAYNRSRGNKPWPISQTKAFFWFVVAHNILLAVYSGWTFVGMWDALRESVVSPFSASGLAGTVDSLCKIQGPRGLGSAIAYNATTSSWVSQSPSTVFLTAAALPAPTDQGRIWNQGLAFYGWFFYLSKFYEVLDTVIILAKGKRSSTLQTYHHAGAMMSMWSGMRYMSPPIWMFVFVNSGIHALMVSGRSFIGDSRGC
jgi:hypothetical protein